MTITRKGVTPQVAGVIRLARAEGYNYAEIAAYYVLNQGAVADVMKLRVYPEVPPAEMLPPDFPAHAEAT